jgi:transcriptional regulator with XRE-family HTH domain
MNSEQFAKTIKELRIKNNLTQKEFANKLGVTYQAVSKWENGKNMPDILLLKEISFLFNMDIDELLTGKKKKHNKNLMIWFVGLLLLLIIVIIFVVIITNNNSNFEFKTITSNCDDFSITGSAAYNDKKTAIYISNVDYCGKNNNVVYKSFSCSLYEDYRNTKTKIGSCGEFGEEQTLEQFLDTVQISVNNYVASCKMFVSSLLYMEIQAIDKENKTTTYQVPINLEDNCKQ